MVSIDFVLPASASATSTTPEETLPCISYIRRSSSMIFAPQIGASYSFKMTPGLSQLLMWLERYSQLIMKRARKVLHHHHHHLFKGVSSRRMALKWNKSSTTKKKKTVSHQIRTRDAGCKARVRSLQDQEFSRFTCK